MSWSRTAWPTLLLALVGACGDDKVTLPCDVAKRACQQAIFRATAESRGQTGAKLPPVRVITRDQLGAELRAAVEGGTQQSDPAQVLAQTQWQRSLALLGLLPLPAEKTADEAYIEQGVSTIAAYYSHGSHDVTVIADQTLDLDDATVTLSHEFVHALQDQRESLSHLQSTYSVTTDDDVALTSLIEGEATWLSYATYNREVRDIPIEQIDQHAIFDPMLRGTLHAIEVADAPLIEMSELMPYPVGGARVAELHLEYGPEEIQKQFSRPLLALRSWVDDAPPGLPLQLDCDLPAAAPGYKRKDPDRLGYGGLMAYRIAQGEAGMSAYTTAEHWRGDSIASYASETDPEAVAVVWRVRLDNSAAADSLAAFARAAGSEATVQENDVVISAATDSELLAAWRPGDDCPAFEKRRGPAQSAATAWKPKFGIWR
jgi:hypothetical protein